MPLVDHLQELRRRILISLLAWAAGTVVGLVVATPVFDALVPAELRGHLIVITVGGAFFVWLKLGLVIGLGLAMPVVVLQLWRFVAPGLTRRERAAVRPWLPLAGLFFLLGLGVAYVVLPFAIAFLGAFSLAGAAYSPSLESYADFVLLLFVAFGAVMEFPIGLALLNKLGILSLDRLRANRRYAFLIIVIFAVVVTPGGDPVSPSVMSVVMYGLYELTIRVLGRSASADRARAGGGGETRG
jgi:sec-independent protein translocase protein TatC